MKPGKTSEFLKNSEVFFVGLTKKFVGLIVEFVGLTQKFVGLIAEFVGLTSKSVGLTAEFVGVQDAPQRRAPPRQAKSSSTDSITDSRTRARQGIRTDEGAPAAQKLARKKQKHETGTPRRQRPRRSGCWLIYQDGQPKDFPVLSNGSRPVGSLHSA